MEREPDGPEAFVLIGEAPLQVLLVRDDAAATEDEPERRWFVAHEGDISGLTWGQITEPDPAQQVDYLPAGLTRDTRVVMVPRSELDAAVKAAQVIPLGTHLMEPSGYCRTCGIVHAHTEWARIHDQLTEEAGRG